MKMSEESQEFDRDFMKSVKERDNERAERFLECLGRGKSIIEIEQEDGENEESND